tara:strand:- start:250 stop:510 length:261 start_codon:yes stop_codon:yes gene_type:complete
MLNLFYVQLILWLQLDSRHGTGSWAQWALAMNVLTYRGKEYLQHKEAAPRKVVELSYRRNVYKSRQAEAKKQIKLSLTYRGITYRK